MTVPPSRAVDGGRGRRAVLLHGPALRRHPAVRVQRRAGRTGPAPPCVQQGPFTVQGETSQYPHVSGQAVRQRRVRRVTASAPGPRIGIRGLRLMRAGTRRSSGCVAARRGAAGPRRVLAVLGVLCLAAAALASGLRPSAATSTLAGSGSDAVPGDGALSRALRRPRDRRARPRPAGAARADGEPRAAARARGLPLGQRARRTREPAGGRAGPCAELARDEARAGRLRPGHVHQLRRGRDPGPAAGAARREGGRGGEGGRRGARARAAAGQAAGRAGAAGATRPSSSSTRSSCATCSRSTSSTGSASTRRRGSTTRTSSPRSSSTPRAGRRRRRRASPTCSPPRSRPRSRSGCEPGPVRRGARAGDRARARGGRDAASGSCATRAATR